MIAEEKQMAVYDAIMLGGKEEKLFHYQRTILHPTSDDFTDSVAVIFIGSRNAGKSHMIDTLVNRQVCPSSSSLDGTTKQIQIIEAQDDKNQKIMFIDTPGFINATQDEYDILTKSLSQIPTQVDLVFMIIDGSIRLELSYVVFYKQIMKWMNYQNHTDNFTFYITKTESFLCFERDNCIMQCKILLDIQKQFTFYTISLPPSRVIEGQNSRLLLQTSVDNLAKPFQLKISHRIDLQDKVKESPSRCIIL